MRFLLVSIALLCGACAPRISTLLARSPARPTSPKQVRVYLDEGVAPAGYRELGLVLSHTHIFVPVFTPIDMRIALSVQRLRSGEQLGTAVFRALIARAAKLGADGVIIKSFAKAGELLSIAAVAIRHRDRIVSRQNDRTYRSLPGY